MLKDKLEKINLLLTDVENSDKDELLTECINQRLTETIHRYNKNLEISANKLSLRNSFKILKAYTKWQKNKDKAAMKRLSEEEKEAAEKENKDA